MEPKVAGGPIIKLAMYGEFHYGWLRRDDLANAGATGEDPGKITKKPASQKRKASFQEGPAEKAAKLGYNSWGR